MMPAPFSEELRWRVIWFTEYLGFSKEETEFYLGVSGSTINRYLQQFRTFGNVSCATLGRPYGTISFTPREELTVMETILGQPDASLAEVAAAIYLDTGSTYAYSGIHYYLQRNGVTRKRVRRLWQVQRLIAMWKLTHCF